MLKLSATNYVFFFSPYLLAIPFRGGNSHILSHCRTLYPLHPLLSHQPTSWPPSLHTQIPCCWVFFKASCQALPTSPLYQYIHYYLTVHGQTICPASLAFSPKHLACCSVPRIYSYLMLSILVTGKDPQHTTALTTISHSPLVTTRRNGSES